jgi:hypothetical protein
VLVPAPLAVLATRPHDPIVTAHGNNWYAFIHVTTASTAWLSVALGIAFIALGLLTAPWLLRRYAALARSLQIPAQYQN